MKDRLGVVVGALFVALAASIGTIAVGTGAKIADVAAVQRERPRLPRAVRNLSVAALQQTADSIQVAVAWSHATPHSLVTGYILEIRTPAWTIADTVPAAVQSDTLWLPKDTVDIVTATCVRATTAALDGPEACADPPFVIPHTTIVSAPGLPTVVPIGSQSGAMDSTAILVTDTLHNIGDTAPIFFVAWTDAGLAAPVMVTCALLPNGEVGWAEVHVAPDKRSLHPGDIFSADPDCGWLLVGANSLDPLVVEITEQPTGPYVFTRADYNLQVTMMEGATTWGVHVRLLDPSGAPVTGQIVTVELVTGAWGNGSTDARATTTNVDGVAGPGNVVTGTEIIVRCEDGYGNELAPPMPAVAAVPV